ncbi:MAG: 16S rRNA (cytosine(1402)-N(4))-methyltransferase RsmH [Vicingaceae bacterium]
MSDYHQSVLLKESIDGLKLKAGGVYVDVTYGGGGHSLEILKQIGKEGKLFAFDQDEDAKRNKLDDERLILIQQNYRFLKNYLRFYGVEKVDGVLADLGVSSYQFDEAGKGFSLRFEGPLDMRMSKNNELTAYKVLNEYEKEELVRVLKDYGEVKNAKKLADEIIKKREGGGLKTTSDLVGVADKCLIGKRNKYLAQVFQAIRIEVNDELNALKEMLEQTKEVLKTGGRVVVITYHSLEDRLVKNFFKTGNFEGVMKQDFYGNKLVDFKLINKKPILPTEEEITKNSRARSAKLRIAEKI